MKIHKLLFIFYLLILGICTGCSENGIDDLSETPIPPTPTKGKAVLLSFEGVLASKVGGKSEARTANPTPGPIEPANQTTEISVTCPPNRTPQVDLTPMAGKWYEMYITLEAEAGEKHVSSPMQKVYAYIFEKDGELVFRVHERLVYLPEDYTEDMQCYISGIVPNQYVKMEGDAASKRFKLDYRYQVQTASVESSKTLETVRQALRNNYHEDTDLSDFERFDAHKNPYFERFVLPIHQRKDTVKMPMPPLLLGRVPVEVNTNPTDHYFATAQRPKLFAIGSFVQINPVNVLAMPIVPQPYGTMITNAFTREGVFDFNNTSTDYALDTQNARFALPKFEHKLRTYLAEYDKLNDRYYDFDLFTTSYAFKFKDIEKLGEKSGGVLQSGQGNDDYFYLMWVMPNRFGNVLMTTLDCKADRENPQKAPIERSSPYIYERSMDTGAPLLAKVLNKNDFPDAIRYANYNLKFKIATDLMINAAFMSQYAKYPKKGWNTSLNGSMVQVYNPTNEPIKLKNYSLARLGDFVGGKISYHAFADHQSGGHHWLHSRFKALLLNLDLGKAAPYREDHQYPDDLQKEYNMYGWAKYGKQCYFYEHNDEIFRPEDPNTQNIVKWANIYPTEDNKILESGQVDFELAPHQVGVYAAHYNRHPFDGPNFLLERNEMGIGYRLDDAMAPKGPVKFVASINSTRYHYPDEKAEIDEKGGFGWPKMRYWTIDQAGVICIKPGSALELLRRLNYKFWNETTHELQEQPSLLLIDAMGPSNTYDESTWNSWTDIFYKRSTGWYKRTMLHKKRTIFPVHNCEDYERFVHYFNAGEKRDVPEGERWIGKNQ